MEMICIIFLSWLQVKNSYFIPFQTYELLYGDIALTSS